MSVSSKDRTAIAELGAAYAVLLDQGRFAEVASLFVEDGVLHRADGTVLIGRANILGAQSKREPSLRTVHHVSLPLIDLLGPNEAKAVSNFIAVTVRADSASLGPAMGYFEDRYRRVAQTWRLSERRIHLVYRPQPATVEASR